MLPALPWPYKPSTHVRSTKTRHAPRTPSARAPLSRTRRSPTPSSRSSTTRRNAQHLVQQNLQQHHMQGGGDAVRDDDARHLTTPSTTISVNNAITITELPGSKFLSNVIDNITRSPPPSGLRPAPPHDSTSLKLYLVRGASVAKN